MIPEQITPENILYAIEKIKKDGYSPARESVDYDMVFQDRRYPPKVVISFANIPANGSEWSSKPFNGGDEANNFLIGRGFPIEVKPAKNPEGFFTKQELRFLNRYANKPYDSENSILRNAGDFIRDAIWQKTALWADRIAKELPIEIKGKKQWNERGWKGQPQKFKDYTWFRLYDKEIQTEKIYFTVGVDREQYIVIKLDCQRDGKEALSKEQIEKFDHYLDAQLIAPLTIKGDELEKMTWKKLTDLSVAFIDHTLPAYKHLVSTVFIEEKSARICWNTEGWVAPSGRAGKAQRGGASAGTSREGINGFAPDEWLMDIEKEIDGYHYSRMEPLHTKNNIHIGHTYNLNLFSLNSIERQCYWIGRIENAEVISLEESTRVAGIYKRNGWFNEQLRQLRSLENVDAEFYNSLGDEILFNVRFRPKDLHSYDYTPFGENETPPAGHYVLANGRPHQDFISDPLQEGLNLNGGREGKSKKKIGKKYQANYKEFDNIHGSIQDDILTVFREMYPKDTFYREGGKHGDKSRIDIVRKKPGKEYVFYEIKTYPAVMYSIRIAVGQLLEYSFYPAQKLTREFIIITHLRADPKELEYLKHLGQQTGCKFGYIHFDWKAKRIIPNG